MSTEAAIRAVLLAHPALLVAVPADRIALDLVDQDAPRPYIVLSKQSEVPEYGLDGTLFGTDYGIEIQVIGSDRKNGIAVKNLVRAALLAAGLTPDEGEGAYDGDEDLEVETVNVTVYETNDF